MIILEVSIAQGSSSDSKNFETIEDMMMHNDVVQVATKYRH